MIENNKTFYRFFYYQKVKSTVNNRSRQEVFRLIWLTIRNFLPKSRFFLLAAILLFVNCCNFAAKSKNIH